MHVAVSGLGAFGALFVLTGLLGARASGPISKDFPWQFRLAAQLRTPVLMFIVIPISYVQAWRRSLRTWMRARERAGEDAMLVHRANVQRVVEQIKAWNEAGRPGKLRTARPTWASMSTKLGSGKGNSYLLEVRHMNRILNVDEENLTVTAEPSVTMGELTHELMPRGLALQTHVEMETITIGGAALGFGIETNSHRVGLFQESVIEYELVDGAGTVHSVTEASDPELFFALPWSVGTAGFLLSIKVRLVRVKPYVRVVYEATNSAAELQQRMTDLSRMGADAPVFLEATMYSAERAVIQAGWYAGKARACHPELPRMRSYLDLVAVDQGLKGRALRWFGFPCELCVLDLQGGGVEC
jgi:Delta24-sterol reductase